MGPPGPARGPKKGGGRKSLNPILKRIKPTRPPSKNQNSSVLGHFKIEIQNFRARTKFQTYFWGSRKFLIQWWGQKGGGRPPPPLARPEDLFFYGFLSHKIVLFF